MGWSLALVLATRQFPTTQIAQGGPTMHETTSTSDDKLEYYRWSVCIIQNPLATHTLCMKCGPSSFHHTNKGLLTFGSVIRWFKQMGWRASLIILNNESDHIDDEHGYSCYQRYNSVAFVDNNLLIHNFKAKFCLVGSQTKGVYDRTTRENHQMTLYMTRELELIWYHYAWFKRHQSVKWGAPLGSKSCSNPI